MKRLISFVFVLALIVTGVGFYRGWFTVASESDSRNHKVDVHLTVDTQKVKEDSKVLKVKAKALKDTVSEKTE